MHNIQNTSLSAFAHLKATHTLQAQQLQILNVMHPKTLYTRRELARMANLDTSTASARINALLDTHIEVVGVKKDSFTGKNVQALMLKVAN